MRTGVPVLSLALMILLSIAASATTTGTLSSSPATSKMVRISGHVLPALAKATKVAPRADVSNQPVTLTIVLKRDEQKAFEHYLNEIRDPRSINFRRYLTQAQIADRFGPSRRHYDAVLTYLQVNGFHLVEGSTNRLTLTLQGTRRQAERAFDTKIGDYTFEKRTFYANDRDPALPSEIASSVQSIDGLANLARPGPGVQDDPPQV